MIGSRWDCSGYSKPVRPADIAATPIRFRIVKIVPGLIGLTALLRTLCSASAINVRLRTSYAATAVEAFSIVGRSIAVTACFVAFCTLLKARTSI